MQENTGVKQFIAILLICIFIIVMVLLYISSTRNIVRSVNMTDRVSAKTLTADNAIYNYEWFKRQKEDIEALKSKEDRATLDANNFRSELPTNRNEWTREDKAEYDRLRSIATGLNNQLTDAIAEYNARSKMATRNIFKDNLPRTIIDGVETGLIFTFEED